jgi:hypothetical protein
MEPEDADRVLVVILKRPDDLRIVREEGWYRIPLATAPTPLAADYLAFYQPAAFGKERWAIRFYAPVLRYRIALRRELLPHEAEHPRSDARYYQIELGRLEQLVPAIPAARLRRITFIPTSFGRLRAAHDVRNLWGAGGDPLDDDAIWGAGLAGQALV